MPRPPTKTKGDRAEQTAEDYLRRDGYRILGRNFRCRRGEVDIIADDKGVLCFVEVRSVASRTFGDPLETVDVAKQGRLIHTARYYIARNHITDREVRFDVVGIVYEPELEITLVKGAFEDTGGW